MREHRLRSFSKYSLVTIKAKYKFFCGNFVKMGELIVWEILVLHDGLRVQKLNREIANLAIKLATKLQVGCKLIANACGCGEAQAKLLFQEDLSFCL